MGFSKLILVLSNLPILVAFLLVIDGYRRFNKELRVFSIFIVLSTVLQILSLVLWFYRINNLPILHIYVGLGFVCLTWFYSTIMEDYIHKWVFAVIAILFLGFTVINMFIIQGPWSFCSNSLTVESILVIVFSLSTFNLFLNETVRKNNHQNLISLNWINAGLFLYFISCLLLFYFGEFITETTSVREFQSTWILHSIFSTVMYICFSIGIWKHRKR